MQIKTIVEKLRRHGHFALPEYDPNQSSLVANVMHAWEKFVRQPLAHKNEHVFENGNGYEYRGPESIEYKETFHLSLPYLLPKSATGIDKSLVHTGKELLQSLTPIVRDVGNVLSAASGVSGLGELMIKEPQRWILRCLHYPPDPRSIRATPHTDKGVTVHLATNTEGLQVFWGNSWQNVPELINAPYGYAGLLGQYHTRCIVPALEHQVVTSEITKTKGRFSLVVFVDFGDVHYDKDTHGRTQDRFPDAEHYSMPYEEFNKMFIPTAVAVAQ